ncbi:MAG: alpha/beta fold hydrolase [Cyclobacteriaceae bacterium]|nr:alpha/beta fold hydrolase [Cyclobacteriaceae bacterium SS2]
MQEAKKIQLNTLDGIQIAANLYSNNSPKLNLIVVAPAAGVPQNYYRKFAEYASQNFDFDVLTFDYRGIGASLHGHVKSNRSSMSEWGSHDMNEALRWGRSRYAKVFLIGHSVAGQVFPKADHAKSVTAAYFVCTQTASKKFWSGWPRIAVNFFWYVALPLTNKIYGYMPGWVLGGSEDLPKKVASEWRRWGLHPQGVLQGDPNVRDQFNRLRIPIHFVNVQDDKILAPVTATREIMHYYGNAVTTFQHIRPKDLRIKKLGHFGFFSCRNSEKLWSMPIMYFTQYIRSLEELSLADSDL